MKENSTIVMQLSIILLIQISIEEQSITQTQIMKFNKFKVENLKQIWETQ